MASRQSKDFEGYRYELLRPGQIIEARDDSPIAFIPLGPMEWHGPHMPYGTDMLHAYTIAMHLAQEFGGLVLPPLPFGSETTLSPQRLRDRGFNGDEKIIGMDFPGLALPSLYTEESAFAAIVRELVKALKRQGFRVVVMVNGHGGKFHMIALERIAAEESEPGKIAVIHGFPIDPERKRLGGHAEKFEASFVKAYYPDSVDLATLPPRGTPIKNRDYGVLDGPTCIGDPTSDYTVRSNQDPRDANEEEGRDELASAVGVIAARIREAAANIKFQRRSAGKPGAGADTKPWVPDTSEASYRYEFMRPQQIIEKRDKSPIAYVPIGPLEWHGPALAYGMDMLHSYQMSLGLAKEYGGVVLPPIPIGSETVLEPNRVKDRGFKGDEKIWGMDFPTLPLPSLYVADCAMGVVLRDLVRSLKKQGFRLIVIVNGHGAKYHLVTLERISAEETEPGKVAVMHGFAFDVGPGKGGHAERYETGFLMAYYPDTVDLTTFPPLPIPLKNIETGILDGPTCVGKPTPDFTVRDEQDPRHASAQEGFDDITNGVKRIGAQMKKARERYTYQPGVNTYYSQ